MENIGINKKEFYVIVDYWEYSGDAKKDLLDAFLKHIDYPQCLNTISNIQSANDIEELVLEKNKGFDTSFENNEPCCKDYVKRTLGEISKQWKVNNSETKTTKGSFMRHKLVYLCYCHGYRLKSSEISENDLGSCDDNIDIFNKLKRLEENKSVSYHLLCLFSLFPYDQIPTVKKTLINFFIPEFLPEHIEFETVNKEYISRLIALRLITENNDSYDLSDVIIKYSQKIDKKGENYRIHTKIIAKYLQGEYKKIEQNKMLEDESLKLAFNSFLFYLESEDYSSAWEVLCYSPRYDKFYDHSLFIYAKRHGLSDKIISCYEKISETDKSFYYQIVVSLCLYLTNKFSKAIKILKSLISEIQNLDTTEDEENNIYYQALLILYKCYFYEDELETKKAQKTLKSIKTYLRTIEESTKNYYDLKINYYLINARINLELGKYQEGYIWCEESLNLLKNIPSSHEINQKNHLSVFKGKTLSLRGRIQCNLGNKNDKELKRENDNLAIKDLEEAIVLFNTDPHSKTICYVFLLQIYLQTDKSDQEKKEQIDKIRTQYLNNSNYHTSYMNALYCEFEGDLSENKKDKKKWYDRALKEANKIGLPIQIKFLMLRLQKKLDSVS